MVAQSIRDTGVIRFCTQQVVERKIGIPNVARSPFQAMVATVDKKVEMPTTFGAERGNTMDGALGDVQVCLGQFALLLLELQIMAAVLVGNGRSGRGRRIEVWRRGGEQVTASELLVARIVGEEVLQEEGRCLA